MLLWCLIVINVNFILALAMICMIILITIISSYSISIIIIINFIIFELVKIICVYFLLNLERSDWPPPLLHKHTCRSENVSLNTYRVTPMITVRRCRSKSRLTLYISYTAVLSWHISCIMSNTTFVFELEQGSTNLRL